MSINFKLRDPDTINSQNFNIRTAFLNVTPRAPAKVTAEDRRAAVCRRQIEDIQAARILGISVHEFCGGVQ